MGLEKELIKKQNQELLDAIDSKKEENKWLKQEIDSFKILLDNSEAARIELEEKNDKVVEEYEKELQKQFKQLEEAKERNVQLTQKYEDKNIEIGILRDRNKDLELIIASHSENIIGKVKKYKVLEDNNIELRNLVKQLAKLL